MSQAAAQAALRADPSDPNGLDGPPGPASSDIPGVACEGNGPPYDETSVGQSTPTLPVTVTTPVVSTPTPPPAQPCTFYPQTDHHLCRGFRDYWNAFGGLAVFGYPITDELQVNGLTVQWFERARFEWHPGAYPARFDVELGLLGVQAASTVTNRTPFQKVAANPAPGCTYFAATGHSLCGGFAAYWNAFGGLAVFGYPITEELQVNGVTVQYFERQRFEWHPGAWPARYDVELGLLGDQLRPQ